MYYLNDVKLHYIIMFYKHEQHWLQANNPFNVLKCIIYLLDYYQTYPNVKLIN
jgi:hypothetical protein